MTRITLYLDAALWQHFRVACLQHHTSASKAIGRLIAAQLAHWAHDSQERTTDHDDDQQHRTP